MRCKHCGTKYEGVTLFKGYCSLCCEAMNDILEELPVRFKKTYTEIPVNDNVKDRMIHLIENWKAYGGDGFIDVINTDEIPYSQWMFTVQTMGVRCYVTSDLGNYHFYTLCARDCKTDKIEEEWEAVPFYEGESCRRCNNHYYDKLM